MNRILCLSLSLVFLIAPLRSQNPADSVSRRSATPYILAGAAALTIVCLSNDQQIYEHLYDWKQRHQIVKDISPLITLGGDGAVGMGIFGAFAGYGYLTDDTRAWETGKVGLASVVGTGIAVQILKHLFGRERPSVATRPGGFWHGPLAYLREPKGSGKGLASFDAFPSGHTTTAFAIATTLTDMYDDSPWIAYTTYSLATIVAVSRITEQTHWASDLVVGAVIGTYGTKLIEHLILQCDGRMTLLPYWNTSHQGLALSFRL